MRQNLKLIDTYVAVVRGLKKENKSSSSLFASIEPSDNQGTVLYIGPDVTKVSVGQKVYFGKNRENIKIMEDDVTIMKEDNLFGVVEDEG